MTIGIEKHWRNFVAWAAARTPRERAIVGLLAAVLGLAVLGQAAEAMSSARENALQADADYIAMKTLHMARQTPDFVRAADGAARAARAASIGGQTIHIARVRAQAEVEAIASTAGIADLQVRVLPPAARTQSDANVEAITLEVGGVYETETFAAFLHALSASRSSLTPLSVEVVDSGEQSIFDIRIAAYALIPGPAS